MNKEELQAAVDAIPYWYHRIQLPYGIVTPGWAPIDPAAYRIPEDLTGKRVLDVGAWDGYWTFEALKRGAEHVTAIDDFSDTCGGDTNAERNQKWKSFDLCAKALGYKPISLSEYRGEEKLVRSVRDVQDSEQMDFDITDHVFFFGVLYHLRHPLKALENLAKLCDSTIHIETAILDGCQSAYDPTRSYDGSECVAEFYPHAEFGMNASNWHVGTLRYWAALVEAAGFKNIETWKLTDNPRDVSECRGFIRAEV